MIYKSSDRRQNIVYGSGGSHYNAQNGPFSTGTETVQNDAFNKPRLQSNFATTLQAPTGFKFAVCLLHSTVFGTYDVSLVGYLAQRCISHGNTAAAELVAATCLVKALQVEPSCAIDRAVLYQTL